MKDITKAKAIELLTTNETVFLYRHGEYKDGEYKPLTQTWLDEHIVKDDTQAIVNEKQGRNGVKKSWGVKFSNGSELRLYGTKDMHKCYRGVVHDVEYVYIFCGFAHMVYLFKNK